MACRCRLNVKKAVILLTIDPASPDHTIISYSQSFSSPDLDPRGCPGAPVLAAILRSDFYIHTVVSGDDYVVYTLISKDFSTKSRNMLRKLFDRLNCDPTS